MFIGISPAWLNNAVPGMKHRNSLRKTQFKTRSSFGTLFLVNWIPFGFGKNRLILL